MEKRNLLSNKKLLTEWNYEKNSVLGIMPDNALIKKKVWWKCEKGHEWMISIASRLDGDNCPYCSNKKVLVGYNDLMTTDLEIALEWNNEKNDVPPTAYVRGSAKKVWWTCKKGHEWVLKGLKIVLLI